MRWTSHPSAYAPTPLRPTFVETSLTKAYLADAAFAQAVLQKIKLGRLGTVEDIMGAVLYLASKASSLVTGTSPAGRWRAGPPTNHNRVRPL